MIHAGRSGLGRGLGYGMHWCSPLPGPIHPMLSHLVPSASPLSSTCPCTGLTWSGGHSCNHRHQQGSSSLPTSTLRAHYSTQQYCCKALYGTFAKACAGGTHSPRIGLGSVHGRSQFYDDSLSHVVKYEANVMRNTQGISREPKRKVPTRSTFFR